MTGTLRVRRGIWNMRFYWKNANGDWQEKEETTGLPEKGNKRRAEAIMNERLCELKAQVETKQNTGEVFFLNAMAQWLDEVMPHHVRANTLTQYKNVFDYHIKAYEPFSKVLLCEVTPALVQGYYNSKLSSGLSINTVLKHHSNIHKFFSYHQKFSKLPENPADCAELPKREKSKIGKYLTISQLQTLFKAAEGDVLESAVQVTGTYGLRRSEVCGLKWENIDFENGIIFICHTAVINGGKVTYVDDTKSDTSTRTLPLTSNMREYLVRLREKQAENRVLLGERYVESGYVCTWEDGSPILPDYVTRNFPRLLKKAGLPRIRFHDLRHSAATILLSLGHTLRDIQEWMGHSDIETTNIYAHFLLEGKKKMAGSMDSALHAKPIPNPKQPTEMKPMSIAADTPKLRSIPLPSVQSSHRVSKRRTDRLVIRPMV